MLMGPKYKVEVWEGMITPSDERDFAHLLNNRNLSGWELHSITPQSDGGETVRNVLVFKKSAE